LVPLPMNSSESSTIGWKRKNKESLVLTMSSAHNTHRAFFFLSTFYEFIFLLFFFFRSHQVISDETHKILN
jgi:hypothetical protein